MIDWLWFKLLWQIFLTFKRKTTQKSNRPCFVLDCHAESDLYHASSQWQQPHKGMLANSRHVVMSMSQPDITLSPKCLVHGRKAVITNSEVFDVTKSGIKLTTSHTWCENNVWRSLRWQVLHAWVYSNQIILTCIGIPYLCLHQNGKKNGKSQWCFDNG